VDEYRQAQELNAKLDRLVLALERIADSLEARVESPDALATMPGVEPSGDM
jgi:hypothetical protein